MAAAFWHYTKKRVPDARTEPKIANFHHYGGLNNNDKLPGCYRDRVTKVTEAVRLSPASWTRSQPPDGGETNTSPQQILTVLNTALHISLARGAGYMSAFFYRPVFEAIICFGLPSALHFLSF
jgi:hypothetical protein